MIPLHKVFIPDNIDPLMLDLRSVISSGWVGEGPKVQQFESEISSFVGSSNVTALNSCTSALQLALRLAGVEPGDEVITTPMTCMATNLPILLAGAKPVWADIDPLTGNISVDSIKKCITSNTKAIMIVHWGGYPCDLNEINTLARANGIKVIGDSAHALGSTYLDLNIGAYSDFSCYSFQAIKHINTGDGGLLVSKNSEDQERARALKWFGINREKRQINAYGIAEWDVVEPGYKYHMNDIAATLGLAQLPYLKNIIEQRISNATKYKSAFANLSRIKLLSESNDRKSSYWLFTVLVDDQIGFIARLSEKGISSSIVHSRNDRSSVFSNFISDNLPGVDKFSKSMVCIPVGPWLSVNDLNHIIDAITKEDW